MLEASSQAYVNIENYQIIHLYRSLNEPQISPGSGKSPEAASAHLVGLLDKDKKAKIVVGLFFPLSKERMMYESESFSPPEMKKQMEEAESFVAEMGFMMDNVQYSSAEENEKKELRRGVPLFYEEIESYLQSLHANEIQVQKAQAEGRVASAGSADLEVNFLEQYVKILSML